MELYADEGEVLLNYSDIDSNVPLDKAAMEYREFTTEFGGERTFKPKVKKFLRISLSDLKDYRQAASLLAYLGRMESVVKYGRGYIEIAKSFKDLQNDLKNRTREIYESEKSRELNKIKTEYWRSLCRHGCKGCSELRCLGDDDYECGATGDSLEVRNMPEYRGKVYQLFNYVPLPTDDCPFNINKTKETDYEHLREYYGGASRR